MTETKEPVRTVWDAAVSEVSKMAKNLQAWNGSLRWSAGTHMNDSFPFRGFVSFSRDGNPAVEDLVFSFDCKSNGHSLVLSSDFCTGEGTVVAEGPTQEISDIANRNDIESYTDKILEFIIRSEDLLSKSLK